MVLFGVIKKKLHSPPNISGGVQPGGINMHVCVCVCICARTVYCKLLQPPKRNGLVPACIIIRVNLFQICFAKLTRQYGQEKSA